MIRYLLSRTGCLLLIMGSILLILGAAAVQSDQPGFNLIFIGIILSLTGLFLWRKLSPKKRRNTRFSKFRRKTEDKEKFSTERGPSWEDRFDE